MLICSRRNESKAGCDMNSDQKHIANNKTYSD